LRVPTREEFAAIAERAATGSCEAAASKWTEMIAGLPPEAYKYGWLRVSGGAIVYLHVDGRTGFGRFLRSLMDDPLPNLRIHYCPDSGYEISLSCTKCKWPHAACLELAPAEAGARAALAVLEEALGVEGWIHTYDRE
jgi:hypothetical protein